MRTDWSCIPSRSSASLGFRGESYEPEEVWVVGDTANDLACARAGGVRCLLVGAAHLDTGLDRQADAYLADLGEYDDAFRILTAA